MSWRVHCCALSLTCRRIMRGTMGPAPWRLHLNSPWLHVAVAFRRRDMFSLSTGAQWVDVRRWRQ